MSPFVRTEPDTSFLPPPVKSVVFTTERQRLRSGSYVSTRLLRSLKERRETVVEFPGRIRCRGLLCLKISFSGSRTEEVGLVLTISILTCSLISTRIVKVTQVWKGSPYPSDCVNQHPPCSDLTTL